MVLGQEIVKLTASNNQENYVHLRSPIFHLRLRQRVVLSSRADIRKPWRWCETSPEEPAPLEKFGNLTPVSAGPCRFAAEPGACLEESKIWNEKKEYHELNGSLIVIHHSWTIFLISHCTRVCFYLKVFPILLPKLFGLLKLLDGTFSLL